LKYLSGSDARDIAAIDESPPGGARALPAELAVYFRQQRSPGAASGGCGHYSRPIAAAQPPSDTPNPVGKGAAFDAFTGPPDQQPPGFVEVEDTEGRSIRFGEWIERVDGHWVLRMPTG
jgi:hypothetical protein